MDCDDDIGVGDPSMYPPYGFCVLSWTQGMVEIEQRAGFEGIRLDGALRDLLGHGGVDEKSASSR
mgnify:CR=1 FL=1|jgi:hypothetical protein